MKTGMTILCLVLGSWGALAQHDHAAVESKSETSAVKFKDAKLGAAYEQYIKLKNALVASDEMGARTIATDLQKALKNASASAAASSATEKILNASGLEEQRLAFSTLSNEITALVKGGKLSAGAVFLEYCPMANKNSGAYWLSNEKEIKNPYFGSMMLKCGSVKETIQ